MKASKPAAFTFASWASAFAFLEYAPVCTLYMPPTFLTITSKPFAFILAACASAFAFWEYAPVWTQYRTEPEGEALPDPELLDPVEDPEPSRALIRFASSPYLEYSQSPGHDLFANHRCAVSTISSLFGVYASVFSLLSSHKTFVLPFLLQMSAQSWISFSYTAEFIA